MIDYSGITCPYDFNSPSIIDIDVNLYMPCTMQVVLVLTMYYVCNTSTYHLLCMQCVL